tara:strand:- start:1449 stop:1670 length:222 start_codon:yes stop_codon:yes gene_type:complete
LVHNYLDKLDDLRETVVEDADIILSAIDIDELLKDPEGYLLSLGDAFLKEHIDEVEKAHKEGEKFAKKVLKKI